MYIKCHFLIKTVCSRLRKSLKQAIVVSAVIFIVPNQTSRCVACIKAEGTFFFTFPSLTSIFKCRLNTSTSNTHAIVLEGDVKQSSLRCGGQWQSSHSPSGKVRPRFSLSPSCHLITGATAYKYQQKIAGISVRSVRGFLLSAGSDLVRANLYI